MIASVAAGNRRAGMLSRIGSTRTFLAAVLWKLKRNRGIKTLDNPPGSVFNRAGNGCMDETNSLIEQRKAKLDAMRSRGIETFKNKFVTRENCAEAHSIYEVGCE